MSALGRITLYALKRALQGGDVLDELTRWRRVVRQAAQAPGAQEMLATLILYMMIKIQGMDSDRASQWVGEALGPDTELNMKTLQELLRDELRKKNSRDLRKEISRELRKEIREDLRKEVREAMAAGEAGARVAGQLDVLLAQLRARFETLSPEHERRLRSGTADQLNAWALRVLTAQSIADVFGPDQPA
jgi:hypothetical protein